MTSFFKWLISGMRNPNRVMNVYSQDLEPNLPEELNLENPIKISQLDIELSKNCNLKCKHCYNEGKTFKNELKKDDWINVLNKFKALKTVKRIIILGGEPTIYPNFYEILEYCIDNFENVILETNGTTKTQLSSYDCSVSISFEDWNKGGNDAIRGKLGKESVFDLAIRKLRSIKNPKIIRFTLTSSLDVVSCMILAEKNNASSVFVPLISVGNASEMSAKVPNSEKLLKSFNEIEAFNEVSEHSHTIQCPHYFLWNNKLYNKFKYKFLGTKRACPAGIRRLFISSTGYVYPCPFTQSIRSMGNVLKDDIKTIYSKLEQFNEKIRNIKKNEKCENCFLSKVCGGGCVAQFIHNHENMGLNCPIPMILHKQINI